MPLCKPKPVNNTGKSMESKRKTDENIQKIFHFSNHWKSAWNVCSFAKIDNKKKHKVISGVVPSFASEKWGKMKGRKGGKERQLLVTKWSCNWQKKTRKNGERNNVELFRISIFYYANKRFIYRRHSARCGWLRWVQYEIPALWMITERRKAVAPRNNITAKRKME